MVTVDPEYPDYETSMFVDHVNVVFSYGATLLRFLRD